MVPRDSPVAAISSETSIHTRASTLPTSSSAPSRVSRAVRAFSARPSRRITRSPASSARLRKQVSLVPVTDRKRPSGPSGTTRWSRETLDADVPASNDSGRTPA